jgi:hypothetical protein
VAWWRRVIYDYDRLGLFAGEYESKHPTEQRNTEQDVDDDSSSLIRAVFLDGSDGGQKVYVQDQEQGSDRENHLDWRKIAQVRVLHNTTSTFKSLFKD